MRAHTDKQYEGELHKLQASILKMGQTVEAMAGKAVQSLVERNDPLARQVIAEDPAVNHLEIEVDDLCIQTLALRQPTASDLRLITIGLRISKDLERIGDLAVNIAEKTLEINREPQLKPYVDLPKMADQTQRMVREALEAFVKRDAALAKKVCEEDDIVDEAKEKIFAELVGMMEKDPQAVGRAARLLSVISHLERLADHATNIAEEVIFMVKGKDIRHGHT